MRVLVAGTPDVALPTLDAISRSQHTIVGVLTRPDAPVGRHRVMTPSPVALWALANGVPCITSNRPDEVTDSQISALAPDIGVVVAYGAILSPATLAIPARGWINLHFSELPRWRGAAPVQRALLAGDSSIGTTVFCLDDGVDTGDILDVEKCSVHADETASELLGRLSRSGAAQMVRVLDALTADSASRTPQVGVGVPAPKVKASEGRLSSADTVAQTYRRFLAMTTEPGAYLETRAGRLKVLACSPAVEIMVPVGRIDQRDGGTYLGLADGSLELVRVQPAGKSPMPAGDWFRGAREDARTVVDA